MANDKDETGRNEALTQEMRDLIFRFDAKDRRDEDRKDTNGGSKKYRRRDDRPSTRSS